MTSIEDFTLSPEKRTEICAGLTPRQAELVGKWMDLHVVLNRGEFGQEMDDFFHPEMHYSNPNRPDLGSYATWKTSPMALWNVFPPCVYRTVNAWGKGDDEITVLCHHWGKHSGGRYWGHEPSGREINVWWYSTIKFKEDKIVHIYSIADVLSMLQGLGVINVEMPKDPYA
ncbi:nuclear transport factor 2 family protein [Sphingobium sp. TCM1]|uniref:nuclear transport factor 2 family protein n=1 Tax=Sphingobium sp. TCM1 TaxID=453246 RepID=UPI0007F36494|nr:nuclear transport factor 2 family protein [Sphingobium sp. TCM1]OAN56246.1 hypothetical protein A7Q26_02240 [Sphingobium sp. TCM1]